MPGTPGEVLAADATHQRFEHVAVLGAGVPPHLVPLVEVVSGERTDPAAVDDAVALVGALGKQPLVLREEIGGFVAMDDLDDVVTRSILAQFGPGMEPRWAGLGNPRIDEDTVRLLLEEVERAYGEDGIDDLADRRDRMQLAVMRAGEEAGHGRDAT